MAINVQFSQWRWTWALCVCVYWRVLHLHYLFHIRVASPDDCHCIAVLCITSLCLLSSIQHWHQSSTAVFDRGAKTCLFLASSSPPPDGGSVGHQALWIMPLSIWESIGTQVQDHGCFDESWINLAHEYEQVFIVCLFHIFKRDCRARERERAVSEL